MCNIAGYTGTKQAAPILIDMIKRQEKLDGGLSTGIATIHNGKLYMAKVTGDVEDLIKNTDALSFPGTVGIIHSRPDNNYREQAHPFVSGDKTCALVSNGNICTDENLSAIRNSVARFLHLNGVQFESELKLPHSSYPQLKNGNYVAYGDVFVKAFEYMVNNGESSYAEAMASTTSKLFSDVVNVLIGTKSPDSIFVTSVSRPMNVMVCDNESYISTSQFGFPEVANMKFMKSVPHMKSCVIGKGTFNETPHEVTSGKVVDYSADEYFEIKESIRQSLKDAPHSMDTMGGGIFTIDRSSTTLRPMVRLIYDILWDLHQEGVLKSYDGEFEIPWVPGVKVKRTFFHI